MYLSLSLSLLLSLSLTLSLFQSTDAELLGEMMFGSMPMKTVGNTVKVHYIRYAHTCTVTIHKMHTGLIYYVCVLDIVEVLSRMTLYGKHV